MKKNLLKSMKNTEALELNMLTYQMYVEQLTQLATIVFKWEGFPETVDERYLEVTLLNQSMCLYFNDDVLGNLVCQTTIGGQFSVNNVPTQRRAYAANGYNWDGTIDNSVLIYDNMLHTSIIPMITQYAIRLQQVQRIIDVNVNNQKMPYIIKAPSNKRLTLNNLMQKWQGDVPFILADKDLDDVEIEILATPCPFVVDKLMIYKRQLLNEILNYIGVPANGSEKKERQVTGEVSTSQGTTTAHELVRLRPRQLGAEQINRMFGLNVSVAVNPEITDIVKALLGDPVGGGENERLHN